MYKIYVYNFIALFLVLQYCVLSTVTFTPYSGAHRSKHMYCVLNYMRKHKYLYTSAAVQVQFACENAGWEHKH